MFKFEKSPSSPPKQVPVVNSANIFRLVGYGLFILAIVNFLDIILPLKLMDPLWELQTAGAVLESIPIPLLSLILIFYGEAQQRANWEKVFLKLLSYVCLIMAILFLLLILVVTSNTVRAQRQVVDTQTIDSVSAQIEQITQLETQLQQASEEEIVTFLESQGVELQPGESKEAKEKLLQNFAETKNRIRQERDAVRNNQQRSLLKNALKWNLTAIISSFIFFYFWRFTQWARLFSFRTGDRRNAVKSAQKTPPVKK